MDEELKDLAKLVIRNCYYAKLSALVKEIRRVSVGLYEESSYDLDEALQEVSNVYSLSDTPDAFQSEIEISFDANDGSVCFPETLYEAIELCENNKKYARIYLDGKVVFAKTNSVLNLVS